MTSYNMYRTTSTMLTPGNIGRFVMIIAFLGLLILQIENTHKIQTLAANRQQSGDFGARSSEYTKTGIESDQPTTTGERKITVNEETDADTHKLRRRHVRDVHDDVTEQPIVHYTGHIGGGTYVRWGRTSCPEDEHVELIYTGIASGRLDTHEGGASNMLCLPNEPTWGKYSDGAQNYAHIYGAEYQDISLFDKANAETLTNHHNMPCVVCRSMRRASVIMIPARTGCLGDWHLEYHGYLMAGHYTHKAASEYICVDEAPESDPAGYRSEDGPSLYRVESICGALPCPQYVNHRDLACSVCSK